MTRMATRVLVGAWVAMPVVLIAMLGYAGSTATAWHYL